LLPARNQKAADRKAAPGRRPHCGRHGLQPRHIADRLAADGSQHGVHALRPDARRVAAGNDTKWRARPRAAGRHRHAGAGQVRRSRDLEYFRACRTRLLDRCRSSTRPFSEGSLCAWIEIMTDTNARIVRSPRGPEITCKTWYAEAAMRMLM